MIGAAHKAHRISWMRSASQNIFSEDKCTTSRRTDGRVPRDDKGEYEQEGSRATHGADVRGIEYETVQFGDAGEEAELGGEEGRKVN